MTGQVIPLKSGAKIEAIIPKDLDEAWRLAKMIASTDLAPKNLKKAEQICLVIMKGMEVGMPPMQAIECIALINGRTTIYGDAVPALLWSNGFDLEEKELIRANTVGEVNGYECTVTRPNGKKITRKFTEKDAKDAKLLAKQGPWQEYRKRMLQMRARGFAARDGASDVLRGMYLAEEARDIPEDPIDITPGVEEESQEQIATDQHEADEPLVALLKHPSFEPSEHRPVVHHYKTKEGGEETFKEVTGAIHSAENREVLAQIPDLFSDEFLAMPWSWAGNARDQIRERWYALEEVSDEQPDSQ